MSAFPLSLQVAEIQQDPALSSWLRPPVSPPSPYSPVALQAGAVSCLGSRLQYRQGLEMALLEMVGISLFSRTAFNTQMLLNSRNSVQFSKIITFTEECLAGRLHPGLLRS